MLVPFAQESSPLKRRFLLGAGLACLLGLAFLALASGLGGCDYQSIGVSPTDAPGALAGPEPVPAISDPAAPGQPPTLRPDISEEDRARKTATLDNVVRLIQTAGIKPGGENFAIATRNLNQYFDQNDSPADYIMSTEAHVYLASQYAKLNPSPEEMINKLQARGFELQDARHIEDCMLYSSIAIRVGGVGDDLTRVRRVFDWMVRQVQLVPPNSLSSPGLGQAFARPYDVLLRGMATESEGVWAERGWLFMVLCRQLGIDVGLLTYTPRNQPNPVVWVCAALIEGKLYLFDTRIGLPIPGPDGQGVATLDQALADPVVLDRLELPGQSPYATSRAALASSASKIGVLIDSSRGYHSPKMRLLQRSLAGKYRTVLYRDPADQRDRFAKALGARFGGVALWELPITVETLLFSSPQFVESTQRSLFLFQSKFPLLYARMKQLRGEISDAIPDYMTFRFADGATEMDKKTPIKPEVQQALDVYATYFLALCHLDQNNPKQAAFFFRETLRLLPEPGSGQPYYCMFRWGAQTNLALLSEAKGDTVRATAYYSEPNPTSQHHGDLLRARDLVWLDPLAPVPDLLPPAPSTHPPAPRQ
jgi:hypothetical protein